MGLMSNQILVGYSLYKIRCAQVCGFMLGSFTRLHQSGCLCQARMFLSLKLCSATEVGYVTPLVVILSFRVVLTIHRVFVCL